MSAILGIYYLDNRPVESVQLGRMMEVLSHRGADAAGTWIEGSVGLGHRLLWTTPESLLEPSPMRDCTGNWVLTADARIDNRTELIDKLGLRDGPPEKITDSALILAAYQAWGEECPVHLLGDFAFAIWDQPRQRLFCARDPMGVKPLYYYYANQQFIFASEIKALLALPDVPCRINEAMVADYLAKILFSIRKEDSFYKEIQELRAAQSLTVTPDNFRIQTYWSPDLSYELKLPSDDAYVEAFRALFIDAVRCRMRSAFPLGSTLSGGLDSTSIACTTRHLLRQENQPNLHIFSAVFPSLAEVDPKIDERPYMEAAIRQGDFNAHDVRTDLVSPLVDLDRVFWHGEEPSPAPNLYLDWEVFKAAQDQNVRVLFTGIDGDTTITYGVQYLSELAASFRWLKLLEEGTALAQVWKRPRRKVIWTYGIRPALPESAVQLWRTLKRRPHRNALNWDLSLLNPTFAKQMNIHETIRNDVLAEGKTVSEREEHWQALNNGSVRYALQWLDKVATAFSLEARHPFCDRRLVEFCLALPSSQKLHKGWTRSILRRAMEGILPSEVQWRVGKGNLSANFKRRLLGDEKEILEQVMFRDHDAIAAYVNIPELQAAYRRYVANPDVSENEATNIFFAVNLALWIKQVQTFPLTTQL
ncbi:MAG: lasso peptide isopeptide bond-forming cyclase [Thermosynechococcaceae cyanobacterium]